MSTDQVDVVVVGMGPGGEEVAGRLAEAGLDVVGLDNNLVGGECPYWGCVPSKMMVRGAGLLAEARRIPGMSGDATVTPDWAPVAGRIRREATDNWDDRVAVERFEAKGGHFIRGTGRLVGERRVAVGERVLEARRAIVLATGTQPSAPPVPGLAEVSYWTNHEAVEAAEVPASLLVLGAGAIGLELAQVFARFGSTVTVIEAADRILAMEEPEVSEILVKVLTGEGISIHTGVQIARARQAGARFGLDVEGGPPLNADRLLVATGRRANLRTLGVGEIGLDETAAWLDVDEHLRAAPGVWGVGDLTGKGAFTHVAMYQAGIAVADILGRDHPPADYRAVPRVTFTDPEVGAVGMTEETARRTGVAVRTGQVSVPTTSRGWIHNTGNEGVIKLVADADRGVLVGATSMGPSGGEVLGLLSLAVHAQVAVRELRTMIYAYPTFHRGIEAAVADLGMD